MSENLPIEPRPKSFISDKLINNTDQASFSRYVEAGIMPAYSADWRKLSESIARGISSNETNPSQVTNTLRAEESISTNYPNLAIPTNFLHARPNILFVPLSVNLYKPVELHSREGITVLNSYGDLASELTRLDLDKMAITNPDSLANALEQVKKLENTTTIKAEHIQKVMQQLIFNVYLQNLELYRLTEDANGTAARFSTGDEENFDPQKLQEHGSWILTAPDSIIEKAKYKLVTYWWRKDPGPMYPYYGNKRQLVKKTLREIEKDSFVSIDSAADCALVTIKQR